MTALRERLRIRWEALTPDQRQNAIRGGIVAVGLLIVLALYYLSGQADPPAQTAQNPLDVIELGDARLEDDIRAKVERERQEQQNQNSAQDKVLADQRSQIELQQKQLEAMQSALESMHGGDPLAFPSNPPPTTRPTDPEAWAPPPEPPDLAQPERPQQARAPSVPAPPPELIGGIGIQRAPPETDEAKRNARRFFLPTSFMPARLLTGLRAKTVESARNDPEPMLLRVQAPAILPNEVRAQLQGCLIVAHGYGSLASERIEARLVSLSCMDLDGKSVIETPLTGILVDSDGVKGLAGRPVSKMGANMARLLAAGLAQGAGASVQAAAQTTSISPLGQTTTIDPAQIARAGTGQGIANATQELTRIYADLVRQSSPVVEVGPSKEVTVVVTEGAWIEIAHVHASGLATSVAP